MNRRLMSSSTSSYSVFLRFISKAADGTVDVKKVFTRECYEFWLSSRNLPPKRPEESFRKAITSHCRGVDGRKPFPPEIEKALLVELRKKQVWPCFRGTKFNIGKRGYQVKGFWEASIDNPPKMQRKRKLRAFQHIPVAKKLKFNSPSMLSQNTEYYDAITCKTSLPPTPGLPLVNWMSTEALVGGLNLPLGLYPGGFNPLIPSSPPILNSIHLNQLSLLANRVFLENACLERKL